MVTVRRPATPLPGADGLANPAASGPAGSVSASAGDSRPNGRTGSVAVEVTSARGLIGPEVRRARGRGVKSSSAVTSAIDASLAGMARTGRGDAGRRSERRPPSPASGPSSPRYVRPGETDTPACGIYVLFLVLAGLADGLAPKERRYAQSAISPNNLGPPLPSPPRQRRGGGGNSAVRGRDCTNTCGCRIFYNH